MTTEAISPKGAIATVSSHNFTTQVEVLGHKFTVDEPREDGGQNLGPSPTRLLSSSLASCQAITMRSYANRKGWDISNITVKIDYFKEVKGKREGEGEREQTTYRFDSLIHLEGNLSDEQRSRLRDIADKCPVHKILASGSLIRTTLVT